MGCACSQSSNATLLTNAPEGPVKESIQTFKEDLNKAEDFVKALNQTLFPGMHQRARVRLITAVFDAADAAASKLEASEAVALADVAVDAATDAVASNAEASKAAAVAGEALAATVDAAVTVADAGNDAAAGSNVAASVVDGSSLDACKEVLFQALPSNLDETRKAKVKKGLDVYLSAAAHRNAWRRSCETLSSEDLNLDDPNQDLNQPEVLVRAVRLNMNPKQLREQRRVLMLSKPSAEQTEAERHAQELDDYWRTETTQARKEDIRAHLRDVRQDPYRSQCFREAYHADRWNRTVVKSLNPEAKLIQAQRDELLRPLFLVESAQEGLAAKKQTLVRELEQAPKLDPPRRAELIAAIDVHCGDQEHLDAFRTACESCPLELQDLPVPADDDDVDELSDFDTEEWNLERSNFPSLEHIPLRPLQQVEPMPVENAQPLGGGLVDGESRLPPNGEDQEVAPLPSAEPIDAEQHAEQLDEHWKPKSADPSTPEEHANKDSPLCCQG